MCSFAIALVGVFLTELCVLQVHINWLAAQMGHTSPLIPSIDSTYAYIGFLSTAAGLVWHEIVKFRYVENPYEPIEQGDRIAKHLLEKHRIAKLDGSACRFIQDIQDEGRRWTQHDIDTLLDMTRCCANIEI
ncbi:hypothetical protein WS97_00655 [Burkholderia territorii]|nr:hypothetical protein WS97_00655 [Burkholderia territorii]